MTPTRLVDIDVSLYATASPVVADGPDVLVVLAYVAVSGAMWTRPVPTPLATGTRIRTFL